MMSVLRKRQTTTTTTSIYDDQSPILDHAFYNSPDSSCQWQRVPSADAANYNNNTLTSATAPGCAISLIFDGTEAWVIGALPAGNVTYPKAVYTLDDGSSGEASPYEDSSGVTVYYSTPENLSPGNHTIFLNITSASNNSPFFFDALLFYPTDGSATSVSGVGSTQTTISGPTTVSKTPVGGIVGGVVGGVVFLLAVGLGIFFFLRRRKTQPYYFDKPQAGDMLGGESEPVPFPYQPPPMQEVSPSPVDATSTSASPPLSFPSPSAHGALGSDYKSSEEGGKASYAQEQNEADPIHHADSGVRFGGDAAPSTVLTEVPPTYTVV